MFLTKLGLPSPRSFFSFGSKLILIGYCFFYGRKWWLYLFSLFKLSIQFLSWQSRKSIENPKSYQLSFPFFPSYVIVEDGFKIVEGDGVEVRNVSFICPMYKLHHKNYSLLEKVSDDYEILGLVTKIGYCPPMKPKLDY